MVGRTTSEIIGGYANDELADQRFRMGALEGHIAGRQRRQSARFEPQRQPFQLAVAQQAGAVQPQFDQRRQFGERVLLDGGDGVVLQVEDLETGHSGEGFAGDRFDPIGRQPQFGHSRQFRERPVGVFDRPRDFVVVQFPVPSKEKKKKTFHQI